MHDGSDEETVAKIILGNLGIKLNATKEFDLGETNYQYWINLTQKILNAQNKKIRVSAKEIYVEEYGKYQMIQLNP